IALLVGAERILAMRRAKLKTRAPRPGAVEAARSALDLLETQAQGLSAKAFYQRLLRIEERFLVDRAGLRTLVRDAAGLMRELKQAQALEPGQLFVAAELARRSEQAVYGDLAPSAEERAKDLMRLRDLVEAVSGERDAAPPSGPGLA